jgi:hypothetical protein
MSQTDESWLVSYRRAGNEPRSSPAIAWKMLVTRSALECGPPRRAAFNQASLLAVFRPLYKRRLPASKLAGRQSGSKLPHSKAR